jgi:hypothetical protein
MRSQWSKIIEERTAMPRREYPKKRDDEKRIVINFSLSGERLRVFREMLCRQMGCEPSLETVREVARDLALWGIDEKTARLTTVE